MQSIADMEWETIILIFAGIVAALILIILLISLLKKRKKKKKETAYFLKKLEQIVRNGILERSISCKSGLTRDRNFWLIKIIETNCFGSTEHFYCLSDGDITIGRSFATNRFCLYDEEADNNHCKITLVKDNPVIVNLSNKVTKFISKKRFFRKRKIKRMEKGESIRIATNDAVRLGETKLVFYVYCSNDGLI